MLGVMSRYVAREFLYAFLVAFCFFFFVFVVNVLLVTAEEIFANEVPIGEVARMTLFSTPLIIFFSAPFGTLLGALMAVSRLSADNEIMAVMAAGISLPRLFLPLAAAGVVLTAFTFVANDVLVPASTIEFNRAYRRMMVTNPSVELEPFTVERYQETTIVTGSFDGGTMFAPLILDRTAAGEERLIVADRASLGASSVQDGVISLHLQDVFSHVADVDGADHEYARADSMDYHILLRDISPSLTAAGPREMSSVDLWREIGDIRLRLRDAGAERAEEQAAERYRLIGEVAAAEDTAAADPARIAGERDRLAGIAARLERDARGFASERDLHTYLMEFHRKFALPLACLAFVSLALPCGLLARRSGRTFGFLVGIGICFLYWSLMILGESNAWRAGVAPAVPAWLPNAVVLAAAGVIAAVARRSR